jgi:hypothetical protein
VVGLAAYVVTQYLDMPLLQDALYYEAEGYGVAQQWLSGSASNWDSVLPYGGRVAWLMIGVIAAVYYLLDGARSVPLLIVLYGALTAWLPVYTFKITEQLGAPRSTAKRAGWLVALLPAFVFWSGSLYKEGLVLLILNFVTYHTLRLQARWRAQSLLFVVLAVFALLGLRFYLAVMLVVAIVIGLLWGQRAKEGVDARVGPPVLVRQLLVTLLFVGLTMGLGFRERAEGPLLERDEGVLVQLDVSRRDLATSADSGYLPQADISTPVDAARVFPIGLLYFLTVPFPWQLGSVRQNLIIPETAVWVFVLYPLTAAGLRRGLRTSLAGTVLILAITGGLCCIYALLSGNVGVAYRMRTQVWLLWAPFAAWGWEAWRGGRKRVRPV